MKSGNYIQDKNMYCLNETLMNARSMLTINYQLRNITKAYVSFVLFFEGVFLAFDFCRFYVVIRFFHPRHNGQ